MLYLNAIRGNFGGLTYYISTMHIHDIAKRVDYVKDVHDSSGLSDMIQRSVKENRADEISSYLSSTSRVRFFNSLVLAIYEDTPTWYGASISEPETTLPIPIAQLEKLKEAQTGIISIPNGSKIITIDGQHRLAGIKEAVKHGISNSITIPVIFISHSSQHGSEIRKRNRELFTVLNKFAKPVNKFERIALDEDEAPAIVTRMLVEREDSPIKENMISFNRGASIPPTSQDFTTKLTTIETLYDVTQNIITGTFSGSPTKAQFHTNSRPDNETLENYYLWAKNFFELLFSKFQDINTYTSSDTRDTRQHRNSEGGSIFFRPRGLLMFTKIFVSLFEHSLEETFRKISDIPTRLEEFPYNRTIWINNRIIYSGEAKARNIILLCLARDKQPRKRIAESTDALRNIIGHDINVTEIPLGWEGIRHLATLSE